MENGTKLIGEFVASFEQFDVLSTCYERDPLAWELASGDLDEYGFKHWRPVRVWTDRSALDVLYAKLAARFPPLYEQLILSYRWAEVSLGEYKLLANPTGPDLGGLLAAILKDKAIVDELTPRGYLQFGRGPDLNYDPICFGRGRD